MNTSCSPILRGAVTFTALALLALPETRADNATWDSSSSGVWNNDANWTPAAAPGTTTGTTSPDIATFNKTVTGATLTVTVDANRNIGGILFNHDSAFGYTLAGNVLLSNGGVIESNAVGTHNDTFSSTIFIQGDGGSATLRNNSASNNTRLIINAITGRSSEGNTTTLYLEGTHKGANNLGSLNNGSLGGEVAVVKNGVGSWRLTSNASNYSGGTTLNAGALEFGQNQSFGVGAITINGGILSAYQGSPVIANALNLNSNVTLAKHASAGTITFTGDVDLGGGTRTLSLTSADSVISLEGTISNGGLTKAGNASSTLILKGVNTYTGDTTVDAGTLQLADNAALRFVVGANGVNNQITGSGTITLDGDFSFELSGAEIANGNQWSIVDSATLTTTTFGDTFSVAGFTEVDNVWTWQDGSNAWRFTESTGVLDLQVIPEPTTTALLSVFGVAAALRLRRKRISGK